MAVEPEDDASERLKQEGEILRRLNARRGRHSLQGQAPDTPSARAPKKASSATAPEKTEEVEKEVTSEDEAVKQEVGSEREAPETSKKKKKKKKKENVSEEAVVEDAEPREASEKKKKKKKVKIAEEASSAESQPEELPEKKNKKKENVSDEAVVEDAEPREASEKKKKKKVKIAEEASSAESQPEELPKKKKKKKKKRKRSVSEEDASSEDGERLQPPASPPAAAAAGDLADDSDADADSGQPADSGDFTVLEEVERAGRRAVHRVLPDWLARPTPIGELRPEPAELPELEPELVARLRQLGVERLFPVQAAVIPELVRGAAAPLPPRDLCVSAPTGSGKTLAFVVPVVQALSRRVIRRVRALAVLPTQALAAQVATVFRQYAEGTTLSVRLLGADTLPRERRKLVEQGPRGPIPLADIVVSTPGRLMDHIATTDGFSLSYLRYLIIDEADRVMEMAETGWLKAVERAAAVVPADWGEGSHRRAPGPITAAAVCAYHIPLQKLLFSATLSQNPEKLERLALFLPRLFVAGADSAPARPGQFAGKFTTPAALRERFVVCAPQLKPLLLHHLLRSAGWRRALVFVNSNEAAHRLALLLRALDAAVAEFSGAVPAGRRRRALADLQQGAVTALVCSDAMARGMDVDAVDAVVSYDIPALVKTYVHRVGRTARADRPGEAVTLLLDRQRGHFQRLMAQAGKQDQLPETPPPLDELRQYEAQYVKALAAVQQEVEREKQEKTGKLFGRAGKAEKKRARKRKPSAVHASKAAKAKAATSG